jgi:hypothetical protein
VNEIQRPARVGLCFDPDRRPNPALSRRVGLAVRPVAE